MPIVRGRAEEQTVVELWGEITHRSGGVAVDRILASAGRCCDVGLVQD